MKAAVITVSDSCAGGRSADRSGPALREILSDRGWTVRHTTVVPDEIDKIQSALLDAIRGQGVSLVATSGGTGISSRDVTPEAIRPLLDREIPGVGELMRLRGLEKSEFAALSRSFAGSIGETIVLCLPGSVKGATESLLAALPLLPHAVQLLRGDTQHREAPLPGSDHDIP